MSIYRLSFLVSGGASVLLVLGGLLLGHWLNLAACPLCIWQRMLYLLLGLLALLGLALLKHPGARRPLALLMAATAASGAWVAGYQVWIQRFAPAISCGRESWWEAFARWAGEQMPLLFQSSGLCSDPAWTLLSLSIADWSLLAFLLLAGLALYPVWVVPAGLERQR